MTHVLDLAEGISREGFFPEILFFTDGPAVVEARKRNIPARLLLKKGRGPVFIFRLYMFLKKNHYDVLHTHTINANFFGRIAAKLSGVRIILTTIHSHIIDELKGLKKPSLIDRARYLGDLVLSRWAKALVVVSDSIRSRLIRHGIPEEKLHVIENSVDTNRFAPDPETRQQTRKELGIEENAKVTGLIGRMVPLKNHDIFIKAAREICAVENNAVFLLVGDGPLKERLIKTVNDLGLEKNVLFTGWRRDMERIINALDVLVLCSEVEGHNIAVLEAMACEKPVVGTDVRGIRTIVKHGEAGVLVPLRSIKALADAVLSLLTDTSMAQEMGRTGRMIVEEHYSLSRMLSQYVQLYRRVALS